MATIGIRELKNGLSRYLKRVRRGEIIEITDRGEPVARIIPAGIPEDIAKLMAEGKVRWSGKRFTPPPNPVRPKPGGKLASDYISEVALPSTRCFGTDGSPSRRRIALSPTSAAMERDHRDRHRPGPGGPRVGARPCAPAPR